MSFQPSQDVLDSPEYKALTQIHQSHSGNNEVLDAFCKPVEHKYKSTSDPSDVEELLQRAWKAVVGLASQSSFDGPIHKKLADTITRLQRRPDLEKDGKVCVVQEMTVWRDLPLFGWQMREAWNGAASDTDDKETQQAWNNINAFTAQLVATAHGQSQDQPDMSLYCIWTIRTALEDSKDQPENAALSAASLWFINAAPAIWDFCKQGKTFDGKVAKPGSQFSSEEWRGFTRDRWRSWSQKFSDVQGQISDDQTARLVERARRAMGEVVER